MARTARRRSPDEDDQHDESEPEPAKQRKSNNKGKARARRDSDNEDEQDEEDDEEPEKVRRRSKKDKGKGKAKEKGGRRKSRNGNNEDEDDENVDDDDDEGGNGNGKSEANIDELARNLVRYAICNEANRSLLRRTEINKRVLSGTGQTRAFASVFSKANIMLKNNFGMELVELFPKPVEDVTKNLKKKKQKPNNEEGDDDGEDSSDEEDENGRKKRKKAQAGDGSKRRGAAKSFCLRSTLDSSVIARCVDALDVEDNEAELRLDNDLKGALGDLGSIKKDLKEWKRGRDVIFDWQTGPDQVTLFGVLYVILSLILVNERVLTDEQLLNHLKRLDLRLDTQLPLSPIALKPEKQTLNHFLSLLIRQNYLEKTKIATGGDGNKRAGAGAGGATQASGGGSAATQRVRATQGTQRNTQNNDDDANLNLAGGTGTGGSADEEWRWGARAEKEIGEDAIAEFIKDFYATKVNQNGVRQNEKTPQVLMKEIRRGASGGKPDGKLHAARDEE